MKKYAIDTKFYVENQLSYTDLHLYLPLTTWSMFATQQYLVNTLQLRWKDDESLQTTLNSQHFESWCNKVSLIPRWILNSKRVIKGYM